MATITEGTFKHGDAGFYSKTWTPRGPTKAKLVFVHGFSEHINRYNDFFPVLAAQGIQVFAWDQRGWGRSVTKPSDKGLTGPTSQVLADVAAFVQDKLPQSTGGDQQETAPVFVMGHSMGGGEILMLASDAQYAELVGRVRGWILECPLVGFPAGEEPSSVKVLAGRLVGRLLPRQQLKHVVPPEHLSRDQAIVESVRNDALCHNTGTLEGLASLLDRTAMLSSGQVRLGKQVRSVLLAHGTQDRACSYDAAIKFMERQHAVEDKTSKTYDGAYHQLHSDHCKDDFAKDLLGWILERCQEKAASSPQLEAKL
ncbi:serine aminopeptidase, s33 domain-containing protein [Hirsutella rhossiliensis]|uniref:Serine aminopeptidase, s33 domain-containing protein n=1 Tax=Hirsutella rhossiliensis TaxID=111463 RepID=A0A9P8MYJ0_9HYPO|nr:serine aminopeptidase, s33 domain-containing protein [Hirsutella rhossiliensis]KAH0964408.1 serine aminopeptidase, s33 domain-containing protein [Hirsutella rhossiliensis]